MRDRGQGQRQRRAAQERGDGRQAEQHGDQTKAEGTSQHLDRPEPEDVAHLAADVPEREVQRDVEQQEHDPKLGQHGHHAAIGDRVQATPAESQPEHEVANDRAEVDGAQADRRQGCSTLLTGDK